MLSLPLIAVPVAVAVARVLDISIGIRAPRLGKAKTYTVNLVFSGVQGCLWFCFGQH